MPETSGVHPPNARSERNSGDESSLCRSALLRSPFVSSLSSHRMSHASRRKEILFRVFRTLDTYIMKRFPVSNGIVDVS
ncbi:MAG: hypothetical protein LBD67_07835 [Candidatus Accumulibacter sp.]|nr:hypothetical protein [Accumulibacter sp.]